MSGGKNPKRYSPEFKEQAAKKVVDFSRPIAQVARELGVNDTTLGFWVKEYRKKRSGEPLPLDMPDQARLQELERRTRELVSIHGVWARLADGRRWLNFKCRLSMLAARA